MEKQSYKKAYFLVTTHVTSQKVSVKPFFLALCSHPYFVDAEVALVENEIMGVKAQLGNERDIADEKAFAIQGAWAWARMRSGKGAIFPAFETRS